MNAERGHSTKTELLKNYTTTCKSQFVDLDDDPHETECLLCEEKYVLPDKENDFLKHLFKTHRLVIADVWKIASLKSYVNYWRVKFRETPLVNLCTTMLMDCTPDGKKSKDESYFLISDCLAEDKVLRDELHRAKLEWVLQVQEQERSDTTFTRGCIFCRFEITGSRSLYLKHLSEKHNLQLGKPENLVFIDKLIDKIEANIENLVCLFCERKFKNRFVLREHMRKKLHKRINPKNKYYDRFYSVNYLEFGQTWRNKEKVNVDLTAEDYADDDEYITFASEEEEESGWSDWNDESIVITCLFCTYNNQEFSAVSDHLIQEHNFNLEEITKNMDFYEKTKIVNYIRYQINASRCIFCDIQCDNAADHMKKENHYKLPDSKTWLQPEFYFPTLEDDSFLYNLDISSKDMPINEIETNNLLQNLHITETA